MDAEEVGDGSEVIIIIIMIIIIITYLSGCLKSLSWE